MHKFISFIICLLILNKSDLGEINPDLGQINLALAASRFTIAQPSTQLVKVAARAGCGWKRQCFHVSRALDSLHRRDEDLQPQKVSLSIS